LTEEKVIEAKFEYGGYGGHEILVSQEIHLVCRGVNQMLEGATYRDGNSIPIDSVSEHVFREGVPLFYNKAELEYLTSRSSVKRETPRKVIWKETLWNKNLMGEIK